MLGKVEIGISFQVFSGSLLSFVFATEVCKRGGNPSVKIHGRLVQFFPNRNRVLVTPRIEIGNDIDGLMPLREIRVEAKGMVEALQCLLWRTIVAEGGCQENIPVGIVGIELDTFLVCFECPAQLFAVKINEPQSQPVGM